MRPDALAIAAPTRRELLRLLALAPVAGALAPFAAPWSTARAQEPTRPGALVRRDGVGAPLPLAADDLPWAARMLVGESGGRGGTDDEAVLWCMLNSYTLRPVRELYPTFRAFVRAYCTPLQPWLKSQGAIDRHRRRGTPMVEVEPGRWQLRRHVELQRRPWAELPAGARELVARTFEGRGRSPCGNATQFCSTAVYFHDRHGRRPSDAEHRTFTEAFAREKGWTWVEVEGANPRANCFFVERRFAALPAPVVEVRPTAT